MATYNITQFAGPNPFGFVYAMNQSGVAGGYTLPSGQQFPLGTIWPTDGPGQLVGLNYQVFDLNNAGDAVGGIGAGQPIDGGIGNGTRAFLFRNRQLTTYLES
jgi:hypothetical protein